MVDLHMLDSMSYDLIVHPVSNTFVPDVRPVWWEAFRVLRHGGILLAGFMNPAAYLVDYELAERTGLPAGVPVSPAVHDQYAAATGVGATTPGDVMFGAGTAWSLLAVSESLMPPLRGAVTPQLPRSLRATYLSLQSLLGRLAFSGTLLLLAAGARPGAPPDWPSLSSMSLACAIAGTAGLLGLGATARFCLAGLRRPDRETPPGAIV